MNVVVHGPSQARLLAEGAGWDWRPGGSGSGEADVHILWGDLPWAARARARCEGAAVFRWPSALLPLVPEEEWALRAFDLVVVADEVAGQAASAAGARVTVIPEAVGRIPPRRVARSELGVDEDDLLIACALDGADHRGGAALLLFAMFSGGRYGVCRGCGRATPFDFHAPSVEFVPVRQCPCGAPLRPAKPRGAHLVLHTAPADRHPAEALDLRAVRTWLRLEGSVTIRDGTIDSPAGEAELAGLLAAADLHLLPHDRPDIPRSLVLASIAGTPTVAPAFGALRDYPGAVSVPVRTETASSGRLRAHLDPGGALDALCQLADSAKLRARRGELGRQVGAAHDPTRVYREWTRVVEAVAVRSRRLAARRRHLLGAGRAG